MGHEKQHDPADDAAEGGREEPDHQPLERTDIRSHLPEDGIEPPEG